MIRPMLILQQSTAARTGLLLTQSELLLLLRSNGG
jgi:hypothetical protein